MRNIMEKQLSWFAILMTAFYSLLASCRAEDCGPDELNRCARPLERVSSTSNDFITTKEELQKLCPDLQAGVTCINRYTYRCMDETQRKHFTELYTGTNMAVAELCQDGKYQNDFIEHAPCMQQVKPQFDRCSRTYTSSMDAIAKGKGNSTNQMKTICCSFQEYLDCSQHAVERQCGEEAAKFTKDFLDRMSTTLIKMHCQAYSHGECNSHNSSYHALRNSGVMYLLSAIISTASRYLF